MKLYAYQSHKQIIFSEREYSNTKRLAIYDIDFNELKSLRKTNSELLERVAKLEEVSVLAAEFKATMQKIVEAHKIACEPKINMPLRKD